MMKYKIKIRREYYEKIFKLTLVSLGILCTMTGCSKTVQNYDYEKAPVRISTEHNGMLGAEQDIKVITFNKQTLDTFSVEKHEDGSLTVILNIK